MSELKSAKRTMQILSLLSTNREGLTLSEISDILEIPRSSTHQLLHEMTEKKFLCQVQRKFRIGRKIFEIGISASRNYVMLDQVRSIIKEASDRLGKVIQFGVLDQSEVVYLQKAKPLGGVPLASRMGVRLPAHATAIGKAMLANLTPEEIEATYSGQKFIRYTSNSISDYENLVDVLQSVSRKGYSEDKGEFTEGVFCLGMSVGMIPSGELGAVSISMANKEAENLDYDSTLKSLTEVRNKISQTYRVKYNEVIPTIETASKMSNSRYKSG
jgi:DNA-binding IclR family transcriptional regulator